MKTLKWIGALALIGACGPSTPHGGSALHMSARRIVERYLSADTSGAGLADSTDALLLPCEGDRATDGIAPVGTARVTDSFARADTVGVTVEYRVLGYAQSWDTAQVGRENWRFTNDVHSELDTFLVVRDASQQSRILCGPYHGNHWATSVMAPLLQSMDSASRAAWARALDQPSQRKN
jgi:hypothetical protein